MTLGVEEYKKRKGVIKETRIIEMPKDGKVEISMVRIGREIKVMVFTEKLLIFQIANEDVLRLKFKRG